MYEKRKGAALDLERIGEHSGSWATRVKLIPPCAVRDAAAGDDVKKLHHIIAQLCELAASQSANGRSGAIMGLAGVS